MKQFRVWPLLLAGTVACESSPSKSSPQAEARSGLRVPLPEGWHATALGADLEVGPQGRAVLLLENTQKPMPRLETLVAAAEADGVHRLKKESADDFIGIRYSNRTSAESAREAFLGVSRIGPRTIWCSTTAAAETEEVEKAMEVCRHVSWEDRKH